MTKGNVPPGRPFIRGRLPKTLLNLKYLDTQKVQAVIELPEVHANIDIAANMSAEGPRPSKVHLGPIRASAHLEVPVVPFSKALHHVIDTLFVLVLLAVLFFVLIGFPIGCLVPGACCSPMQGVAVRVLPPC